MNRFERAEARLLAQAQAEGWSIQELARRFRRSLRHYVPSIEPPTPTDAQPGTREKILVMQDRVRHRYRTDHAADPKLDSSLWLALLGTQCYSGGNTDLECVDIRPITVEGARCG